MQAICITICTKLSNILQLKVDVKFFLGIQVIRETYLRERSTLRFFVGSPFSAAEFLLVRIYDVIFCNSSALGIKKLLVDLTANFDYLRNLHKHY